MLDDVLVFDIETDNSLLVRIVNGRNDLKSNLGFVNSPILERVGNASVPKMDGTNFNRDTGSPETYNKKSLQPQIEQIYHVQAA